MASASVRGWADSAEAVNVPAAAVKPIPGAMNYEKAASYGTAYMTAYVALKVRGDLRAGEWLLVHARAAASAWRRWTSASTTAPT